MVRIPMNRMHHTAAVLLVMAAMIRGMPPATAARVKGWVNEATGNTNATLLVGAACEAAGMP